MNVVLSLSRRPWRAGLRPGCGPLAPPVRLSAPFTTDEPPPPDPEINPPATTRPPRLDAPARDPSISLPQHLFRVGRAYVDFYKTGVRSVLANRRLLATRLRVLHATAAAELPLSFPPSVAAATLSSAWRLRLPTRQPLPTALTRADWVLLWRVRRDLLRLPVFGLVLLACGEFTPLLVPWLDRVIPHPCRIPRQVAGALERTERRRRDAFDHLERRRTDGAEETRAAGLAHVIRSLDLAPRPWELLTRPLPAAARWRLCAGVSRLAFLEGDDALLVQGRAGVSGLLAEEVKSACAERGIDVLGRSEGELRRLLGDWLRLTAAGGATERRRRIAVLLTRRPDKWPPSPNFPLPEWEL